MVESSYGALFFLKKPKNEKGNRRYVYVKITVDGIPAELSVKRTWYSDRWNSSSGRASGTKEDAKALNSYLDTFSNMIYDAKKSLLPSKKRTTAKKIKSLIKGEPEAATGILALTAIQNKKMESLIGIEYEESTVNRFRTSYSHTRSFIRGKYKVEDLDISDLDFEFISEYYTWLRTERQCSNNTALKYIGNFKKIVIDCIRKKLLPGDPFIDFKKKKDKIWKNPLTTEELKMIMDRDFSTQRLELVRDVFLFACYTGLSYVDVKRLKSEQIFKLEDGELWIIIKRKKSGIEQTIPILPVALKIINKYNNHPKVVNKGVVIPISSNQKVNDYLKEIQDLCKINKNMTFHLARHTFATTITLGNGVPIDTVSRLLGHTRIPQTEHYAQTLLNKISHDMKVLKNKISPKIT